MYQRVFPVNSNKIIIIIINIVILPNISFTGSRCICNSFSKRIGFKDGYPVCTICGTNSVVTTDGNDCVPCNGTSCKCAPNEVQSNV